MDVLLHVSVYLGPLHLMPSVSVMSQLCLRKSDLWHLNSDVSSLSHWMLSKAMGTGPRDVWYS